ncbi:MAG: MetQ/NlpA family ABC transporter substrate-binding protein [Faecalibacterium sp.]
MSITRRNFLKATGASAAALSLAACSTSSTATELKVAVPNDTTNEARALILLEKNGFFTLEEGVTITATKNNIAENPLNITIDEIEAAQIPNILQDEDYAVINSNYAISAGMNPVEDALAMEDSTSDYVNILVCRTGEEDTDIIKAVVAAITSQTVADFIDETYGGSVVSAVDAPTDGYDASIDYDALNGTTVTCGASPAPHCEILEVAAELLEAKGITLVIQEYTDYIIPNTVVDDGTIECNFFQHVPYLDEFNVSYGTSLVSAAGVHVEPMGIYGGKQSDLSPING